METPEQTLMRAEACLLNSQAIAGVETPAQMKQQIDELQRQLDGKTALCEKLQGALTRLMSSKTDAEKAYDLSGGHLATTLALYTHQVWFSIKTPQVLEGIFNQLATVITNDIECGRRTKAFTHDECVELVDKEVRSLWEKKLPPTIINILSLNMVVYSSHADLKSSKNGAICEPIHFLVYLIRRIYNHVTNHLFQWRQHKLKEEKLQKSCTDLGEEMEGKSDGEEEKDSRLRWQDNPTSKEDLVKQLEASRRTSECILTSEECTKAVEASATKLCSKPVLTEAMKHISSIVALQDRALSKGWNIPHDLCAHRSIFSNKMLEVWMKLRYPKDFNCFRVEVFQALNSLLMLKVIRDGVESIRLLINVLLGTVKGSMRAALTEASNKDTNLNLERLFVVFSEIASTDTSLFYVHVFIELVKFFSETSAHDRGDDDEPETILLNLLRDLAITPGTMSALENQGYIRVISVVTSTIFPGMTSSNVFHGDSSSRTQYALSAAFIGRRIFYLLRLQELTVQEERDFWESGTTNLLTICGQPLLRVRNLLPRLLLPVLSWQDEKEMATEQTLTTASQGEREGPSTNQHEMMKEADFSSLKPKELKKLLKARGLPCYGTRELMLSRLTHKRKDTALEPTQARSSNKRKKH